MMGLIGNALAAANTLRGKFPNAVFTSGLRTVAEQARAMAANVAADRHWIKDTYIPSKASGACQDWVFEHPSAQLLDIEIAITSILHGFTPDELAKLSKHLSGQAFDVLPIAGRVGLPIKNELRALAAKYGGKFLEHEGSLSRWHWQE